MVYKKNRNGKYIPVKEGIVYFEPNPYSSTTFLSLSGEMFNGIPHPNGIPGYQTAFTR